MVEKPKTRLSPVRILQLLLIALGIFYFGACLLVFSFQRKLLYPARRQTTEMVSARARDLGLQRWTNSAGQAIGMKQLARTQPATGSVLILYGNGGSATGCGHYVEAIQSDEALDVFVLEYPGYQDRPGSPNQNSLLQAAREGFQLLDTNRPIYLVGESLGTGIAANLAGQFPRQINGIMLLSPYARLADVAQYQYAWLPARLLLLDDFRAEEYLHAFHGPVGVMLDGNDTVVPSRFGRQLFDHYAGAKRLWEYPRLGHIQIGENPAAFWQAVIAFWQLNQPSPH